MAKTKKNRAGLSEKIAIKSQKKKAEKLNPFDVRFVKSKQKILGRKRKQTWASRELPEPRLFRRLALRFIRHVSSNILLYCFCCRGKRHCCRSIN